MAFEETMGTQNLMCCLTTDTKPTTGIVDGTYLMTFDNTTMKCGKIYQFFNGQWYELGSSS